MSSEIKSTVTEIPLLSRTILWHRLNPLVSNMILGSMVLEYK